MKILILISISVFVSLISYSQKYLISVSTYELSTISGNKSYSEMVLGSEYKLKYDMNENFILDLDKFRITTLCGKYRNISDITDIDTLSNNVFLIKYNEESKNDSSIKTEIILILDLNSNNQKIIQTYYDVENNFTTLKTSSKKDLIVLTTD